MSSGTVFPEAIHADLILRTYWEVLHLRLRDPADVTSKVLHQISALLSPRGIDGLQHQLPLHIPYDGRTGHRPNHISNNVMLPSTRNARKISSLVSKLSRNPK